MQPGNSSEAGRLLAAQRRIVLVTCEECGGQFQGTTRRRYCSNACNVRAWRRAHRPSEPATGRPRVPLRAKSQQQALTVAQVSPIRPERVATPKGLLLEKATEALGRVRIALFAMNESDGGAGVSGGPGLHELRQAQSELEEALSAHRQQAQSAVAALEAARQRTAWLCERSLRYS
jgi:hypothetical protein